VVGHRCGCGDLDFCCDLHLVGGLRFVVGWRLLEHRIVVGCRRGVGCGEWFVGLLLAIAIWTG
jgi:hypothetical protein